MTMEERWRLHLYAAKTRQNDGCRFLNGAIRKYGREAFSHEVIEVIQATREGADDIETAWIAKLNCLAPHGFNLAEGGKTGSHHPLSKQKMKASADAMGKEKRSARTKQSWTSQTPEERTRRSLKLNACKKPEEFERRSIRLRQEWGALPEDEKEVRRQALRGAQAAREASLTPEQKTERGKKLAATWKALPSEERSELARKRWATRDAQGLPRNHNHANRWAPEVREAWTEKQKKAFAAQPPEQRERVLKNLKVQTREQLRANALKSNAVRRAKSFRAKAHAWLTREQEAA
jgi:group I intron endonuclease